MNTYGWAAVAIVAVLLLTGGWYVYSAKDTESPLPLPGVEDEMIEVAIPQSGATVTSPARVAGRARGNWYFEASFPVKIIDANGNQLGIAPAQAQGEWMTTELVPFDVSVPFTLPTTREGFIVLEKDNPSGLPEHADERRIPVQFTQVATDTRAVQLYFYNPEKDKDAQGNILCSAKGLVAIERAIPRTTTPLADTIKLLLKGEVTSAERAQGITTEFPVSGFSFVSAAIRNNIATVTFDDSQNRTTGGACRVAVLWAQIEATAKQFPSVTSVQYAPDELFQP